MFPLNVIREFRRKEFQNELLFYNGDCSHLMVAKLLDSVEKKLVDIPCSSGIKKKIIHVFMECLQNALKHGRSINGERRITCFIGLNASELQISVGNHITTFDCDKLTQRLDQLLDMDQLSLSDLFRTQLKDTSEREMNSSGLGLIDIMRNSGRQLTYNRIDLTEEIAVIIFHISIPLHS